MHDKPPLDLGKQAVYRIENSVGCHALSVYRRFLAPRKQPWIFGLSQGSSVREHGDEPPDLGWLKLGRMKDGTRSAGESPAAIRARPSLASVLLSEFLQAFSVAVRTFAKKGSGPLAEVEDMVAKTHMDGPFRKFRGRPQGKVAISSCGRPWNSYDIARRLYRILRIATLLFILLNCFC